MNREFIWLSNHPKERLKYPGEYIVIVGNKIIAHGKDPVKVLERGRKYSSDPFLAKVPKEGAMIV